MPYARLNSARVGKGIVAALGLACLVALIALVNGGTAPRVVAQTAQAAAKLDASILTYDGKDFIRTETTLVGEDGKPAVNTKLDHNTPAYKALSQKRSYSGAATVFGRKYEAHYAPVTSAAGELTGALFVGVPK